MAGVVLYVEYGWRTSSCYAVPTVLGLPLALARPQGNVFRWRWGKLHFAI
jgi:hypothetical protein